MRLLLALAASKALFGAALPHDLTADQQAQIPALTSAAYHCAPAVAAYNQQRRRAWEQKVLSGHQASLTASPSDGLFAEKMYQDLQAAKEKGEMVLSCDVVSDTQIANNTCVLASETVEGPYYHRKGHPIRKDLAENEFGLLLMMDVGVIDVETCMPMPNVLVDLWMANATGHYAGHPEPEPHMKYELPQGWGYEREGLLSAFPRSKPEETFLRGAYPTDKNGVAQFTSIFPGYYTGRATHIHTKVMPEWTPLENGTFEARRVIHTGQFFFEDDLNMQIDKMWPYNTNPIANTIGRTRNWNDSLQIFPKSFANGYNPIFKAEKLGAILDQGLIAYITMGVNGSAVREL